MSKLLGKLNRVMPPSDKRANLGTLKLAAKSAFLTSPATPEFRKGREL